MKRSSGLCSSYYAPPQFLQHEATRRIAVALIAALSGCATVGDRAAELAAGATGPAAGSALSSWWPTADGTASGCDAPPLAGAGWTLHPVGNAQQGSVQARWLDAQETVEQVPAPPEVLDWLRAFTDEHFSPEPKRRARPQSFRPLADRFGQPARVSTGRRDRAAGET